MVNISKSKNESKSQLMNPNGGKGGVVVNISKSKNESKSQQRLFSLTVSPRCGKYQ